MTKPLEQPVIAYKRAILRAGDHSKCLKGVIGKRYSLSSKAAFLSPGFHAYRTYKLAQNHPQDGNVFLEVLLSGKVKDHDLGWKASEQRVLQIIPHCTFGSFGVCKRQVRYYYSYFGELRFNCRIHGGEAKREASFIGVERKPIADLKQDYSAFKDDGVVVALGSGRNRFIPTTITSS